MTLSLTKRLIKGSALTATEHDANLAAIEDKANEKNPYGGIYWTVAAALTVSTPGEYAKVPGTTAYSSASRHQMDDDSSTSNRLRYTGSTDRHFTVRGQVTVQATAIKQLVAIEIYHYDASAGSGSLIEHSIAKSKSDGASDEFQISTHADVTLSQNDYLEIWITDESGSDDLTVTDGYLFAAGLVP